MVNLFLFKAKVIIHRDQKCHLLTFFSSRLIERFTGIISGNVFHSWVVGGMNEFAYSSVLWAGMSLSYGCLRWWGFVVETRGGNKLDRYRGQWWLIILWNISSLWRFRLSFNVQNPDSLYNFSWLVPLTAPAIILMASKCRFRACSKVFQNSCPKQCRRNQTVVIWRICT